MSIIIGFVSDKCATVASDGREIFNGSSICSDNVDKTFMLDKDRIIGAAAGTTQFQNKNIALHLSEIITVHCQANDNLGQKLAAIETQMKTRLENVNDYEIAFQHRRIDLILIGTNTNNKKDLKIYSMRFKPNASNNKITVDTEVNPSGSKQNGIVYWNTFGDNRAQQFAEQLFINEINKAAKKNLAFLVSLSYKAIREGIKNSDKHPNNVHLSCGGKPFVKKLK